MKLTTLCTDDSAVSPTIGVILMVVVSVILAAVIGIFVLNLGSLQRNAPQASFSFEYTETNAAYVAVTHEEGDAIERARIDVTTPLGLDPGPGPDWSDPVSVGGTENLSLNGSTTWNDETVRVVWESENGETSTTLSTSTAPS